jgi:hypothetical protein
VLQFVVLFIKNCTVFKSIVAECTKVHLDEIEQIERALSNEKVAIKSRLKVSNDKQTHIL